jgi:hypothetical protein
MRYEKNDNDKIIDKINQFFKNCELKVPDVKNVNFILKLPFIFNDILPVPQDDLEAYSVIIKTIDKLLTKIYDNIKLNKTEQINLYLLLFNLYKKNKINMNIAEFYDTLKIYNEYSKLSNNINRMDMATYTINENYIKDTIKEIEEISKTPSDETIIYKQDRVGIYLFRGTDTSFYFEKDSFTDKKNYIVPLRYRVLNEDLITKSTVCFDFTKSGYCMKEDCTQYHIMEITIRSMLDFCLNFIDKLDKKTQEFLKTEFGNKTNYISWTKFSDVSVQIIFDAVRSLYYEKLDK